MRFKLQFLFSLKMALEILINIFQWAPVVSKRIKHNRKQTLAPEQLITKTN